jgi:long-subunit fatty acid transport protein
MTRSCDVSRCDAPHRKSGGVHAAGFQASEQSNVGLGRALAGTGIVGADLPAAFYNPAGMSLLRGTGGQAGIRFVQRLSADADSDVTTARA